MLENKDLKISYKKKKSFNIKDYFIKQKNKKDNLPISIKKNKEKMKLSQRIIYILKIFFVTLSIVLFCGGIVGSLILYSWIQDTPELDISLLKESAQSSYIYDINGNVIAKFSSSENRSWASIEEIPQDLIDAFLCIEDIRFYEHEGIDIKRFSSAVLGQFVGSSHGGSTITQQLIKNAYLTNEVTYKRKIQEIILAFQLESKMTKDEIFESYLNIIYFGEANYGVKTAAEDYFGKSLDELTLKECALLAGLVKNPNGYSPRKNMYEKQDMSATDKRTTDVLWNMYDKGYITKEEYDNALNEEYNIKEYSSSNSMYKYPHFVEYVINDVVDDLIEKENLIDNGTNRSIIEWKIRNGGYKIYTTLDPSVQNILQDNISDFESYPKIFNSNNEILENTLPEVASVIMDHKNGYITAMIGSRQEPTAYKTFNRATKNTMPIGSTIKPLSAFAPSIEMGQGTGSIGYNYAYKIEGYDHTTEYPKGNMGEQKPITYRMALQRSSNVVPAQIICQSLGYDLSKQYLTQLGISENNIQENGSGLALGTSGINILELTAAYSTLANGGIYLEPKSYIKVTDRLNNVILESKDYQIERQVFSESTSWMVTNILESVIDYNFDYAPGTEGVTTAGKSGTHEDKCATYAGYTHYYTSAIWIGTDNYASFDNISGTHHSGKLFSNYMTDIHNSKSLPDKQILSYNQSQANIVSCEVCNISGLLANEYCKSNNCSTIEYYKSSTEPQEECNIHTTIKFCKLSNNLATDVCPTWSVYEKTGIFIPKDNYLSCIPVELVQTSLPGSILLNEYTLCPYHASGNNFVSDQDFINMENLIENFKTLLTTNKPTDTEKLNIDAVILEATSLLEEFNTSTELNALSEKFKIKYDEWIIYYDSINNKDENISQEESMTEESTVDTSESIEEENIINENVE
jgi:penicillin-binding protein 1A